ncbi:CHAT domain-containing protein [Amycolatopsis saalfeldensis]|uniref:CHAT domain-containing protein n=1 Tax=Amycolatopsis saalfeldensis TaxID=394193 RepID=A0A1H8VY65_9PSEU|nr:CHAT domain-containing protein [Amycolatopsis saalfeldensis]SEP20280.1 CHAT domain-containing protein [Amycolatopsis saalfeldensis]
MSVRVGAMPFDDLLHRVQDALDGDRRPGQADPVLDEAVLADAVRLRELAGPADPAAPTRAERRRLAAADQVAGRLHYLRWQRLPDGALDLATALVLLWPFSGDPRVVPEGLRPLIGPAADAGQQAARGAELLERAQQAGDPVLLDMSVRLLAAAAPEVGGEWSAQTRSNLGAALLMRHVRTENRADLDGAIETLTRAVAEADETAPYRPQLLGNLSAALSQRFRRDGGAADLGEAIAMAELAVGACPPDDPYHVILLANLGMFHRAGYEHTGEPAALERALDVGERAVQQTPSQHPNRAAALHGLGLAYRARFERAANRPDLDRALDLAQQSVASTPAGDPRRKTRQDALATARSLRDGDRGGPSFELLLAEVNRALDEHQRGGRATEVAEGTLDGLLVAAQLVDRERRARALYALAWLHYFRYRAAPDPDVVTADFARAVGLFVDLAIEPSQIPPAFRRILGPAAEPQGQGHIGSAVLRYALDSNDTVAFYGAQTLLEAAVGGGSYSDGERADFLADLSSLYLSRFERGAAALLDPAVDRAEQSVAIAPAPRRVSALRAALHLRFTRFGRPADLDRLVEADRQLVGTDHANRAHRLADQAIGYRLRYGQTDSADDLRQAVRTAEEAVVATDEDSPDLAMRLSMLAQIHRLRYERDGDQEDLHLAVAHAERAVLLADQETGSWAFCLSELGSAYLQRSLRLTDPVDLERAVEMGERAVAASAGESPLRTNYLSALGEAYQLRFRLEHREADLDRQLELGEQAVAGMPEGYPDRIRHLRNLSGIHLTRYQRPGGDPADLGRALELAEQALAAAEGTVLVIACLEVVAACRFLRHRADPGAVDRATIEGLAGEIARAAASSRPPDLISPAHLAGTLASDAGQPDLAVRLLDLAVAQLPLLTPGDVRWPDQEFRLIQHSGLVGRAVAAHFAAGDPAGAAGIAEAGRAVVVAGRLGARTDLSELQERHPGLAAGFAEIRDRLDRPGATVGERDRLRAEREELLTRIRQQDGFARFLEPPRPADLRHAAADGTIVLVNPGLTQGDALVITPDAEPVHLELPLLTEHAVGTRAAELLDATHATGLTASLRKARVVTEILEWLWDAVAGPVAAILPGAAQPSAAQPGSTQPGPTQPSAAQPGPTQPGATQPGPTQPSAAQPDAAQPGAIQPDAAQPGAIQPDAARPGAAQPSAAQHGAAESGASQPNAAQPNAAQPSAAQPSAAQPSAAQSGASQPNAAQPTASQPSAAQPGAARSLARVWWLPVGRLGVFPLHAAGRAGQLGALDLMVSSYTPTLRALADARARPPARVRRQLTVAVSETPGLPDLPGTAAEAAELHAAHPGTRVLSGAEATIPVLLDALADSTWVHFACHAGASPVSPSLAHLQLPDGSLPVSRIGELRMPGAELAYLSACSTAHGGELLADEAVTLASAFHLAGFRHVVGGLWPLSDRIAADAARLFYRNLPDRADAGEAATALREVALRLRDDHPDRPDLWAGLVHSGA